MLIILVLPSSDSVVVTDSSVVLESLEVTDSIVVTDSLVVIESAVVTDSLVVIESPVVTDSLVVIESPVITDSSVVTSPFVTIDSPDEVVATDKYSNGLLLHVTYSIRFSPRSRIEIQNTLKLEFFSKFRDLWGLALQNFKTHFLTLSPDHASDFMLLAFVK